MAMIEWLKLQLFAEGGDGGGEGAASGDTNAAAAGQDNDSRLRELGVPEKLLNKRAKKAGTAQKAAAQPMQQAAAAETTEDTKPEENKPTRMSWEEVKADPEYNAEMQKMMQERVKKSKEAEEYQQKISPFVSLVAEKYGIDPSDIDALTQAVYSDDSNFEDRALAEGKPVEEIKQQANQNLEQQKIQQHIQKLEQQGEAMKQTFPNFDLRTELQNPAFARMTSPSVGLSVEDAYYAVHRKEIQAAAMQVTAQKTAQKLSNSIQANQRRPEENGTSGQAASVTTFDYAKASKADREALKARIRRGEKIYPGR